MATLSITINGREAIPVRAIPLVTGWNLSPDEIAKTFAHLEGTWGFQKIRAYHSPDNPTKFEPAEWDNVVIALESLSSRLNELAFEGMSKSERKERWRQESIKVLPEGVFVWRDEFEPAYDHYVANTIWSESLREGEREANLSAYCSDEMFGFIMAGFESCPTEKPRGKTRMRLKQETPPSSSVPLESKSEQPAGCATPSLPETKGIDKLDFAGIAESPAQSESDITPSKQRQQAQDENILRAIRHLGHDPEKIPKWKSGQRGIKAEVRGQLRYSKKVFDLAWERLRKAGEIMDATPSS